MLFTPCRVLLSVLLASVAFGAEPLRKGPGQIECPNGREPIELFTYKPPTYQRGPLFVICHGVQRNAEDYRNFAITLAERFGAIVVAPKFDNERFPSARYQRGGLQDEQGRAQPPEKWTYAIIPKIVAQVRAWESRSDLPYYLIGHSAGG